MEYRRLILGPLDTNCYILYNEKSAESIVVDPAAEAEKIIDVLNEIRKTPKVVVLTHTHFDHIGALKDLKDAYKDMKILLHPLEKDMLKSQSGFARFFGIKIKEPPPADGLIDEGDVLQLGDDRLEVLYTPGHSSGSISLLNKNDRFIIVGDLLFQGSIGRTDFPGGSFEEIKRSIQKKVYSLSDDFIILSGHGEKTRVGVEKKENPFVRGETI